MFPALKQPVYQAFGLTIQSELPLPELQPSPHNRPADIAVLYADLSDMWSAHSDGRKSYHCSPHRIVFRVPGLAVFAVEDGTSIRISPEEAIYEDHEDKLRLYVLGTCMGAALLQRRILPLHGSAVVIGQQAYAFVGHSGHGKSTLASALLQRGCHLLSDDVIAVKLGDQDKPYAMPAYPQQKLWQESLDVFGLSSDEYRPLFDRETKYAVPVASRFTNEALPLAGVFELVKAHAGEVSIRPVNKLERLPLLHRHTYRNMFLEGSGLTKWHFDATARMAAHLDMHQLVRPAEALTVQQLTELVLHTVGEASMMLDR
ncbi:MULTISPECIES: aldolase [unclassified Paenibacillus]|uniref:aldolase n=1 Tax=unclassified Paenibacillus TaxID=185978 RepID=UPI000BA60872|nr:aldolase [Paenibacillus sp. 7541]PAK52320.1 aldolase [Paenibacillus sp. 7541]